MEWTEEKVESILVNPIYTGMGPYQRIIEDQQWVGAAANQIKNTSAETFLAKMLVQLRESFAGSPYDPPA